MLVINARFKTRPVTGVERYAHELTRRLRGDVRFETPSAQWRGARGHVWEQCFLPFQLASGEWLFSPANTGPILVRRQIITIHDLSPIDHPEWFSRGFASWYRFLWFILARQVRGVLTDSDYSRERIIKRMGISPEKVVAIPTGVDTEMFHPVAEEEMERMREKYKLGKEFLLFVGSLQPRKNLPRLLSTWQQIRDEFTDIELVIVGAGGPQFYSSGRTKVFTPQTKFLGYVPDQDLPGLYSSAVGLVHPGLYEGSGLTLLEAMACGCPVAASDNTALPEIVGDAGILFNPFDEKDMLERLRYFLRDGVFRGNLRVRGNERIRKFTWERVCDEFHESLHKFQVW